MGQIMSYHKQQQSNTVQLISLPWLAYVISVLLGRILMYSAISQRQDWTHGAGHEKVRIRKRIILWKGW